MKKNLIPSFASSFYSLAHPHVYDATSKKRIVNQVTEVLKDFLKSTKLNTLTSLDLGCSVGITTSYLSSSFKKITGSDVDKDAIGYAKKIFRKKNLDFIVDDATKTRFKSNMFDVVVCQEVYENVEEPQKLFDEIYRILKHGGVCYFAGDNLLFPIETQYDIPFLLYLPDSVAQLVLKLLGHKKYYLGHFKTYWQLRRLCKNFIVHDYTLKILKNPQKYQFSRLLKYKKIVDFLPDPILSILYYFLPTYIWILEKPKKSMA